jgi:cobalt-zinc-cadmium efflux system membrane fusion protein
MTMPSRLRRFLAWGAARVPGLLTLALLVGLAFWGARYDWTLPAFAGFWGTPDPAQKTTPEAGPRVVSAEGTTGTKRVEFPSAEAVRKAGIAWKAAEVRTLSRSVTANGMVDYEPSRYVRLTARTAGVVWQVYKEIGDPVHKGEVLALLDAAEVGKAKADFLQSLTQVKMRSTTLERLQATARQGAVPERSLREAETALREARIRLFNDQQTLLNLGLPVHVADLEKLSDEDLVRRLRLLGLPPDVVKEHDPETLTANLLPLTAPWDGQVVERFTASGDVVQMTAPKTLFILADVRQLHVDLDVNPEDMPEVRVGQPITFRTDGGATEVKGHVSHLSPEVDEKTRRVRVHAEVPNEDRRLRPNAFGTGDIQVAEQPDAVVIPGEAVQSEGTGALVFVRVSDTGFEVRPVQPGLRAGDLVAVRGVRPGEEVVTTGSFALKSELQKDRIAGGDD